jgi:hypothetical protein
MIIVCDFDGTCVKHEYPKVGADIGAARVLKRLVANGHKLILFTMRSNAEFVEKDGSITKRGLTDAVEWFERNEIPLYGIQVNPTQHHWTTSPKAYGELIIDDAALGCPLLVDFDMEGFENLVQIGRPYVDWISVEKMLEAKGILPEEEEEEED